MKELIMKIENYLHLYMGCDVLGVYSDQSKRRGHLSDVINGGFECGVQFFWRTAPILKKVQLGMMRKM